MLNNIQALRAFAAISVVMFHALGVLALNGHSLVLLKPFIGWGANGVDLFFVISGFIMAYTQTNRPWYEFILSRIVRIAPLYWLISIFSLLTALLLPSLFTDLDLSAGYVIASLGFSSQLFGFDYPLLSVGWTLEFEMFFYVLLTIGMVMFRGRATFFVPMAALTGLAAIGVIDWIVAEFSLGILCFFLFDAFRKRPSNAWAALHCLAWGFLIATVVWRPELHRSILFGLPSALLVLSAALLPQMGNYYLQMLGTASYSIYLVHLFVISAGVLVLRRVELQADAAAIILVSTATLAGIATWYLIEKPIGQWLKNRLAVLVPARAPVLQNNEKDPQAAAKESPRAV